MISKRLVAASILALAAGATFAALTHSPVGSPRYSATAECGDAATNAPSIPRVIVTARRDLSQSGETQIARVVVSAKRLASASDPAPRAI